MLHSSNIRIISSSLLKVAKILRRDFNELEKIQNTKHNIDKFVFKSLENIKESIIYDLKKARPESEVKFVEEEKFIQKLDDYTFIVDPISGIKNFSNGISYFASSIALQVKEEVITSVIYDPIRDEMFFAEKGKGAYLNNSRIRVSSNNKISRASFVLENIDLINALLNKNNNSYKLDNFRVLGSCSLDFANTANVQIDGYITNKIDFQQSLAGLFLAKEAGVVIHESNDFTYSIVTNNNMIANF